MFHLKDPIPERITSQLLNSGLQFGLLKGKGGFPQFKVELDIKHTISFGLQRGNPTHERLDLGVSTL